MKAFIKTFGTLMRREWHEHWKKWSLIALSTYALSVCIYILMVTQTPNNGANTTHLFTVIKNAIETPDNLVALIANILIFLYLYNVITREKENNNISFWRSLPPNDVCALCSKLVFALVAIPLFSLLIFLALKLCLLVIFLAFQTAFNLSGTSTIIAKAFVTYDPISGQIVTKWLARAYEYLIFMPIRALWLLPLASFLMLMQSSLKRGGAIAACLTLVFLGAIETSAFESDYVNTFMSDHLGYGLHTNDVRSFQVQSSALLQTISLMKISATVKPSDRAAMKERTAHLVEEKKVENMKKWSDPVAAHLSEMTGWTFISGLFLSGLFFGLCLHMRKRYSRY